MPITTVIPFPKAVEPPPATPEPGLLDEAAAGPEHRVLIIGAPNAELLCSAVRHGCRGAIEVARPPACPEPADIVVAPHVTNEGEATAIMLCARRALAGSAHAGRLALALGGKGANGLARAIVSRLRAYGFSRITLRARAEGDILLLCLLPAPRPVPLHVRPRR